MKLGERLIKAGLISVRELESALEEQQKYGGRLGDILRSITHVRSVNYYHTLADHFSLPFLDVLALNVDKDLMSLAERNFYFEHQVLPVLKENNELSVATSNPSDYTFQLIQEHFGKDVKIYVTTKFDILWTLQKHFDNQYIHEAINDLLEATPHLSASLVLNFSQKVFLLIVFFVFVVIGLFSVKLLLLIMNILITIGLCGTLAYKLILTIIGLTLPHYRKEELLTLDTSNLPLYTIMVPLYKENNIVLEHIVHKLGGLDYPKQLLDIKLIVETQDTETINLLKAMNLPIHYELIYVPVGGPMTKPKACNYALKFARGEFITIYDAEDHPESDQLKKVVATFRKENDQVACVQCQLSYYNSRENWLTKLFTLEYSYWFDLMLPALSKLNLPIPLGGTSNHLKTSFLQKISAWDPFNVTEDAELGIRLYRLGLKTKVIDSTTFEEAPCQMRNWFKQRTRWLKGYMQTYLSQMRRPINLFQKLGVLGFLSFQFFVGGTILSNLTNIGVWVIFGLTLYYGPQITSFMFPFPILEIAWFNFIVGSVIVVTLNLLAALRRRFYNLMLYSLTAPFYWLMMSVANWRAFYQLITKPSYWEHTNHGESNFYKKEQAEKQKIDAEINKKQD